MATAKIEERVGIVLSRIPQKEKDAMVRCLGPSGFFSFYARGALKMGGVTNFATQELASTAFNLVVSNSGALTLKEARLGHLYAPQGSLEAMLVASLCLEYCLRCVSDEDAESTYPLLQEALNSLELGKDPFTVAVIFLAKGSIVSGNGLEVGHCVVCGAEKNIVTLDYVHGGFLCADCLSASMAEPCGVEELKVYRHAFRCPLTDMERVVFPIEAAKNVLRGLLHYVHDYSSIRLRSLEAVLAY